MQGVLHVEEPAGVQVRGEGVGPPMKRRWAAGCVTHLAQSAGLGRTVARQLTCRPSALAAAASSCWTTPRRWRSPTAPTARFSLVSWQWWRFSTSGRAARDRCLLAVRCPAAARLAHTMCSTAAPRCRQCAHSLVQGSRFRQGSAQQAGCCAGGMGEQGALLVP